MLPTAAISKKHLFQQLEQRVANRWDIISAQFMTFGHNGLSDVTS
jgi:hypothetical protein